MQSKIRDNVSLNPNSSQMAYRWLARWCLMLPMGLDIWDNAAMIPKGRWANMELVKVAYSRRLIRATDTIRVA